MRPTLLRSVAVSCGLLLSSCGGSDESAQGTGSPSAKSEQGQSSATASPSAPLGSAPELVLVEADGFSVSLPTEPRRATQEVPSPVGPVNLVLFVSETSTSAFVVSYVELSSGQGVDLPTAVESAAQNVGGTVREQKETSHQGFPARDARITGARDGRAAVYMRAIVAKGRLYQAQYTEEDRDVAAAPPIFRQVIDSLRID